MQFICLAFYQKEMALYARANLDRHVLSFCPDADLHPEFKARRRPLQRLARADAGPLVVGCCAIDPEQRL